MFEALDFVYSPSADVAGEVAWFADVLGAEVVFAIEAMGTRVAMLRLAGPGDPALLLAGHLEGERPVLVYRVADLEAAMAELEGRGWTPEPRLEIPHGPICAFSTPGGQRLAIYQLTRPDVAERLVGRRDF